MTDPGYRRPVIGAIKYVSSCVQHSGHYFNPSSVCENSTVYVFLILDAQTHARLDMRVTLIGA